MDPILAAEFDVSKITYGAPRTMDSGAKMIRVNYKKGPFVVQTPDMIAPFGVNKWEAPNGGASKHSLELSFKDLEDRPELVEFKAMLDALDKKFVDDAFGGVLPSHNKKFASRDVVDVLYQPMVKPSKDDKYPPNFKMTLPVGDREEFTFPTYVVDAKTRKPTLVDLNSVIAKGATCTAIMQCNGVWVAGGSNFGCTWKVTQLRIKPPMSKTAYAFKDLCAEEGDVDVDMVDDVPFNEEPVSGVEEDVDGGEAGEADDNEDDLDPIDSVAAPPPPSQPKKTVKKTAKASAK